MKQHFLIVANGPFLSVSHIQILAKNKIIIALDGAIEKCEKIKLMPNILLGDFDSLSKKTQEKWGVRETFNDISDTSNSYTGNFNLKIIPAKDQSKTDLEKAIAYCDTHHAATIDIVCATGGCMDHTLAALQALKINYRADRELILHTKTEKIFYLKNKKINLVGKIGDRVGITGFPKAILHSTGLIYNGNNTVIEFGITSSFCNQLASAQATLDVDGEALIIAQAA